MSVRSIFKKPADKNVDKMPFSDTFKMRCTRRRLHISVYITSKNRAQKYLSNVSNLAACMKMKLTNVGQIFHGLPNMGGGYTPEGVLGITV